MEERKLRVVVIGTGNVAGIVIRYLKGRKNMELLGVGGIRKLLPRISGWIHDCWIWMSLMVSSSQGMKRKYLP